MLKQLV